MKTLNKIFSYLRVDLKIKNNSKTTIIEYGDDDWATPEKENDMDNIKIGIDAFNDLAKSHDAHAKEVERLQEELNKLNKLKLVDQTGELLLECRIGDKYHRALLELGMKKLLEGYLKDSQSDDKWKSGC